MSNLRLALRSLAHRPLFSIMAILILALGIGANIAIFSVVHAALVRPLPFRDPEQLVLVWERIPQLADGNLQGSPADYLDLRTLNRSFQEMAGFEESDFNLGGAGEPERVTGARVSASLFPLLGVAPQLGRWIGVEEDRYGGPKVALISHALWMRRFGGDSGAIGKTVMLNHQPHTIAGIMPREFTFPASLPGRVTPADVWVPLAFTPEELGERGNRFDTWMIARLKPGVTVEAAAADVDRAAREIHKKYSPRAQTSFELRATATALRQEMTSGMRPALLILQAAAALVLLIACANLANLLLARATGRQREIAIRGALGAGRARILRMLVTESLALSLAGGFAGALLAMWLTDLFLAIGPETLSYLRPAVLSPVVVSFAAGISVFTGVLFGLAPAIPAARRDINSGLKHGGRGVSANLRRSPLRKALILSEVAFSVMLLTGSGLLIKSFLKLLEVDPGFRPENRISFSLDAANTRYPDRDSILAFSRNLRERLSAIPGVKNVSLSTALPLSPRGRILITPDNQTSGTWGRNLIWFTMVEGDYIGTLGIGLKAGRKLDQRDRAGAALVAVVNEAFAQRFWPGENPLGRRFKWGSPTSDAPMMEVAGVVHNTTQQNREGAPEPAIYIPMDQASKGAVDIFGRNLRVVVQASSDAAALLPAIKAAVRAADPDVPMYAVRTLQQSLQRSETERRFVLWLVAFFAAAAMLLAAVGLFAVMSHSVAGATREIGIRMALGARSRDVAAMVLSGGMKLVALGLALGLAGAVAATRLMRALLFQVSPADPWVFASAILVLAAAAALACWWPARRASRIDPVIALRNE
ncbi:MAG: ABC transporter permease [Bryobacteraceae bacterium]|nr:ABC transporter permease [Bryobacteraceae bacterium]